MARLALIVFDDVERKAALQGRLSLSCVVFSACENVAANEAVRADFGLLRSWERQGSAPLSPKSRRVMRLPSVWSHHVSE
jgi:hypothetical protein